ncbi:MAG: hypothetical protein H7A52_17420, partial [Akkermansiaceae bacterium]|nr:hypothetical protein [Akkermansiaceae bacterium]
FVGSAISVAFTNAWDDPVWAGMKYALTWGCLALVAGLVGGVFLCEILAFGDSCRLYLVLPATRRLRLKTCATFGIVAFIVFLTTSSGVAVASASFLPDGRLGSPGVVVLAILSLTGTLAFLAGLAALAYPLIGSWTSLVLRGFALLVLLSFVSRGTREAFAQFLHSPAGAALIRYLPLCWAGNWLDSMGAEQPWGDTRFLAGSIGLGLFAVPLWWMAAQRLLDWIDRHQYPLIATYWSGGGERRDDRVLGVALADHETRIASEPGMALSDWVRGRPTEGPTGWIERIVQRWLTSEQRRALRFQFGGWPRWTRQWAIGSAGLALVSLWHRLKIDAERYFDSAIGIAIVLFSLLLLLGAPLGGRRGYVNLRIGFGREAAPLFAGFPVALRDLVIADLKILSIRGAAALFPVLGFWKLILTDDWFRWSPLEFLCAVAGAVFFIFSAEMLCIGNIDRSSFRWRTVLRLGLIGVWILLLFLFIELLFLSQKRLVFLSAVLAGAAVAALNLALLVRDNRKSRFDLIRHISDSDLRREQRRHKTRQHNRVASDT